MTSNDTLREKLEKEYFFVRSRTEIVQGLAKEVWTIDEDALVSFLQSELLAAKEEGAREMKEKCLEIVEKDTPWRYGKCIAHLVTKIQSL